MTYCPFLNSERGTEARERVLGGLEEEGGRAGSVQHLPLHLKALLQSFLGGSRFVSENPQHVRLWHQRDHKNLLHKVTIKLISLPRTHKGFKTCL